MYLILQGKEDTNILNNIRPAAEKYYAFFTNTTYVSMHMNLYLYNDL